MILVFPVKEILYHLQMLQDRVHSDSDIKADDTPKLGYISDSDIKGRCYYIIHLK